MKNSTSNKIIVLFITFVIGCGIGFAASHYISKSIVDAKIEMEKGK
jgi:hypothetical protein